MGCAKYEQKKTCFGIFFEMIDKNSAKIKNNINHLLIKKLVESSRVTFKIFETELFDFCQRMWAIETEIIIIRTLRPNKKD